MLDNIGIHRVVDSLLLNFRLNIIQNTVSLNLKVYRKCTWRLHISVGKIPFWYTYGSKAGTRVCRLRVKYSEPLGKIASNMHAEF